MAKKKAAVEGKVKWVVTGQAVKFASRWYQRGDIFKAAPSKVRWLADSNEIAIIPTKEEDNGRSSD